MSLNPVRLGRQAVLVSQNDKKQVTILKVYDPTLVVDYTRGGDQGITTLSYAESTLMQLDPSHEQVLKDISLAYVNARVEAIQESATTLPALPSADDLAGLNLGAHEAALQAVYALGVQRGAQLVEYPEERWSKELKEARWAGFTAAYNAVSSLFHTRQGTRSEKGLHRALRELRALREQERN